MLLYSCNGIKLGTLTDEELIGAECFTNNNQAGTPLVQCTRGNLVASWAVGGEVSVYMLFCPLYIQSVLKTYPVRMYRGV